MANDDQQQQQQRHRYVVLPAHGFTSEVLRTAAQLRPARRAAPRPALRPAPGPGDVRVLDSIRDDGPRLVEMTEEAELRLRVEVPGIRVLPVVRYHPARAVPRVERGPRPSAASTTAATRARIRLKALGTGEPVAGARVLAFTNYRHREGDGGESDGRGEVALRLRPGTVVERLYVFAEAGFWGRLERGVELAARQELELRPIDAGDPGLLLARYYRTLPPDAGTGIVVGVVDSGVARSHPALANVAGGRNLVFDETAADPAAADDWGPARVDGAHGTHVAGIVGGSAGAWRGVAPGVSLRSYRVFPHEGGGATNYDIAKAIEYAALDGCHVVNLSLGGADPDEALRAAIGQALARGVLVVAAAGNDGRGPVSYPAAWPACVAVSAMGRRGSFPEESTESADIALPFGAEDRDAFVALFSNVGPQIDLTGPGVGVVSTVPEAGFGAMSGTSMACPAVAGFAAYLLGASAPILAEAGEARSTALKELLYRSARPQGFGRDFEAFGLPLEVLSA